MPREILLQASGCREPTCAVSLGKSIKNRLEINSVLLHIVPSLAEMVPVWERVYPSTNGRDYTMYSTL